ncbi:hypothetical protein GTY86_35695 [Streptomyces sp. SID5770]|uniref:hypothetical protein n=1 Tax=Streptomyces sp. SID5770 TaxID=2690308 RepID=UPI001370BE6F|nr:hypothetical protein [Streptomyces sp. SID5770]MZE53791.1 hypothetical protein [Streptomyces sp. SID5770]MZE56520.1 hypothetical protein [Streptomyces sp. SID5770]
MTEQTETTYLVWICQQCRRACKVQPEVFTPGCRCEKPVPKLRPTIETQMHAPKKRPVRLLSEEEARLRNLILSRQRVRVTFEADVVQAWTHDSADGSKQIQLIVTTPDGRRHAVDTSQPGVRIDPA